MSARILMMPPPSMTHTWATPLPTRVFGSSLVAVSKEETSMRLILNHLQKKRPAAETQAHAERIVQQVRSEVARHPEFAPFADRPASDIRRPVGSGEPAVAGRMLRGLYASLRAMRLAAR